MEHEHVGRTGLHAPLPAQRNANKAKLLAVLEHPDIPLHTNGSENDIRCQVTPSELSGGQRSDIGRDCKDAGQNAMKRKRASPQDEARSRRCARAGVDWWECCSANARGRGCRQPKLAAWEVNRRVSAELRSSALDVEAQRRAARKRWRESGRCRENRQPPGDQENGRSSKVLRRRREKLTEQDNSPLL